MRSFKELRKASGLKTEGKTVKMVVMGNVATQFMAVAVSGYARLEGINLEVCDTDYNQIDAQVLDSESVLYKEKPDYVFLWLASEKLYEEFLDMPAQLRETFADMYMNRIENWWNCISEHLKTRILVPNLVEIDDKALGQFSAKTEVSFIFQLRKLNYILQERMAKRTDIFPVDFSAIQNTLGRDAFFDRVLYYSSKMSIAINALPYAAKAVTDILKSFAGMIKKCVVLDLDNTLWGGVIGDDGVGGIEIGELGRGHVFSNFQRWLKELKECGIILTVCSKNDADTAKEPFISNSEMILKLSDISVFVANWDDKASNIRLIRDTLNIGMDSMVFIDDNPFERNLVRELIPEIIVPEMPEDPALYVPFLQQENLFDTVSYTGANEDRTRMYQQEFQRRELEKSFESIDDYLKSLDMVAEAKPFSADKFARISELSRRSNQFNLRTVRYTEADVENMAADKDCLTLYFTLKDKFGEYGLVSAVIMKRQNDRELFVDTWFMSCRVLKRGMEDFIVNSMFKAAKEAGYSVINAEYIPTPKNKMVKDIYREKGFEQVTENTYTRTIDDYIPKNVWIRTGD